MKKKINSIVILCLLAILIISLTACGKTIDKVDNDETYNVYVAYAESGGTLSYEEWLASIKGERGNAGVGIASITKTGTSGLFDIYTITFTDGSFTNYSIANGEKGDTGEQGLQGEKGERGEQGLRGEKGEQGLQGEKGEKGDKGDTGLTPYIGENGNWWIGAEDTGVRALDNVAFYGDCGESVIWTLYKDGKLVIEGEGDVDDSGCSLPWIGYSSIWKVEIKEGVTSVASHSFDSCQIVKSVFIPCSVTSIGACVFYNKFDDMTITYAGSMEEWNSIEKNGWLGDEYEDDKRYLVVVCTDGNLYPFGRKALVDGIRYRAYDDGTAKTVGVENANGMIVIPGKIEIESRLYDVTGIGYNAFNRCSNLTSITIPDSVTSIEAYAFYDCVASIEWGNTPTITTIGSNAFCGYRGTSITIPDSVTDIGEYSFRGCRNLTSVTIGSSVKSIEREAFSFCFKLIEVYNKSSLNITVGGYDYGGVGGGAKAIYTQPYVSKLSIDENGYILYTDESDVFLMGYTGIDTELTLPIGVTEIYEDAFCECSNLTSITISSGVTKIGAWAFYDCDSLTSIVISDGVTSVGEGAFSNCGSLESVTIPSSVASIGYDAFSGCSSLTSIAYTGTVEEWNMIDKRYEWNHYTGEYTVHCTDGDITK